MEEETSESAVTVDLVPAWRGEAWAVEIQDSEGARQVPITGRMTLGTSRSAQIRVFDPMVSSLHCEVQRLGGGLVVQDTGSKNGTFVGGARVDRAWGGGGTTVVIGQTTLTFVCEDVEGHELPREAAPLSGLAGGSLAMRRLGARVRVLAKQSSPVLVMGETGTGKELVARALHVEGSRVDAPFIALNVAALPRELVESELFGHERGAFTGAIARRRGAFKEAAGGTLCLDEVGELPLDAQPKLLRALDGYEVRAVGSHGAGQRHDARIVAATHVALEQRVLIGQFRRDLFHRLEVYVLEIPPLRERRGDVGAIARVILERAMHELGPRELTPRALARLVAHDWPGNVRELRNVILRAAAEPDRPRIDADAVDRAIRGRKSVRPASLSTGAARALLVEQRGNISRAARAAGVSRSSFRRLIGEGA